ncbi:hypothetical protein [Piscinibacter terrae]|uniref:Uncharacterized protein n=1 Tax=Piscinibacter terrae TaxID=2496871 RepID=A0A3N7HKU0_9BURK|nr:hypothetical protein [Albitalea terrae]RQP22704.1 hypothetical protein DZC73_20595 [Albitalea terrae]
MANPWLKKNPFMSMWLSSVNAAAGSMRGHALGQAKRQASTAMTQGANNIFEAWAAALVPKPPAKSRKRKRR